MYHLTGSTPDVWRRDFDALAAGGFHRLLLAETDFKADVFRAALDLCAERSLRGYCIAWNPSLIPSVERYAKYRSVGIDGQTLDTYNPFHAGFRRDVLRPHLRRLVAGTSKHSALGGYFFDDVMDAGAIVSYTAHDAEQFRAFVLNKYGHVELVAKAWGLGLGDIRAVTPPRIMLPWREGWRRWWDDWCAARQRWWLDWSDDALAEIPVRPGLERVLGDHWYNLRFARNITGGYAPEMAAKFESFSFDYTRGVDFLDPAMTNIDRDIAMARDLVGSKKLTVFLKAASSADQPFPDMRDVIKQSQRCLAAGVAGIDYYIYRAWLKNYAFKNCLANHPEAFKELARFIKSGK